MRITLEADYAVRIIECLAAGEGRLDAKEISDKTGVTLRFTLKILRKLVIAKLVRSYKGVRGGYELNRPPAQINLKDAIEAVDGPILINRCVGMDNPCSRTEETHFCYFHSVFAEISEMVQNRLASVTFEIAPGVEASMCGGGENKSSDAKKHVPDKKGIA